MHMTEEKLSVQHDRGEVVSQNVRETVLAAKGRHSNQRPEAEEPLAPLHMANVSHLLSQLCLTGNRGSFPPLPFRKDGRIIGPLLWVKLYTHFEKQLPHHSVLALGDWVTSFVTNIPGQAFSTSCCREHCTVGSSVPGILGRSCQEIFGHFPKAHHVI